MGRKISAKGVAAAAYIAASVLFILFAVYMFFFEHNTAYSARQLSPECTLVQYTVKELDDVSAPAGIRKEYSWRMQDVDANESCLIFYLVHSYAEVRFDDELMYSLMPGEDNRIGSSPGSNWIIIPVRPSDSGREVTVTVTPVYKSVINRKIEFQIGSRYAVLMGQLRMDLPQIVLSVLCILVGILLIAVQLYYLIWRKTFFRDLFYLGNFSLLMGIWRVTDTRISAALFGNHTMALGYITLGSLFLMAAPMLLFAGSQQTGKRSLLLKSAAVATCVVVIGALACQVFGIAELRELLTFCHVVQFFDIVVLLAASFLHIKGGTAERGTLLFILLLVVGSISDIAYFYLKNTSSGMMLTLCAFLIYTAFHFANTILTINKKAYWDAETKLYNKARWDEFMEESVPADESIGIMMLDLNGLKHTNDTFGHDAGDRMIVDFAGILRKTVGAEEFLCRWGGDEFTVLVRNANREKMQNYESAIHAAVDIYNASGERPDLFFACGYALSDDYPALTRRELLVKADESMYRNKKKWYDHSHA